MKVIQNTKKQIKILYVLYIIFSLFITNSVFAESIETSITIKPSLSLNIPTNTITMNLDPSIDTFAEQDLTIKVSTNNPDGFKLYVTTPSNNTDLVNTADSTKTIPNLTSSYATSAFPVNNWGYRITEDASSSSGNYGVFTSSDSTPIMQTTTATNEKMATLSFAAKIDYTKPSGLYELNLSFKALPIVTQYTMQELGNNSTLANQVCTTEPTVVIDSRDNQLYTISKLKDGNCWMTQNLKLGKYSTSLILDSTDSNTNGNFTLDGKLSDGKFTYTTSGEPYANNNSQYYCTDNYGCYYNWYTATAGTGSTTSITTGSTSYSICPSGWRLPTGGTNGEFQLLFDQYPSASSMLADPMISIENINGRSSPGFLLGSYYSSTGGADFFGKRGYYWSNSTYSIQNGYSMRVDEDTSLINPTLNGSARYYGLSVRCLISLL